MWALKAKREAMARFADLPLHDVLLKEASFTRQKARMFLLILAVLFIIFALLRPQWGYEWEDVKRKGVDIVIALDVSRSMLAADIKPSRLERAKKELENLVKTLKGDRVGLVSFAGSAFVQCPLTLDYRTFKIFLDDAGPHTIPLEGTDIGAAIRKSVGAFDPADNNKRVLILVTDGEDHEERVMEAVEQAKRENVVIYAIGAGMPEGAPIPVQGSDGELEYVKDPEGQIVLSKQNTALLRKIAGGTGGQLGSITASGFPLEDIYLMEIDKMEKKELGSRRNRRYEERFAWPLAIALLLYFIEGILSERKKTGKKRISLSGIKTSVWIISLIFQIGIVFFAGQLFASDVMNDASRHYEAGEYDKAFEKYNEAQAESPEEAKNFYNMGNALYKMNRYKDALQSYQAALSREDLKDRELANMLLYNKGNTYFRQGLFEDALEAYKTALDSEPDDEDIKYNIEFTQRKITEMEKQAQETAEKAREEREKRREEQSGHGEEKPQEQKGERSSEGGEENKQEQGDGQKSEKSPEEQQDQGKGGQAKANEDPEKGEQKAASTRDMEGLTRKEAEDLLKSLSDEELRVLDWQDPTQGAVEKSPRKSW